MWPMGAIVWFALVACKLCGMSRHWSCLTEMPVLMLWKTMRGNFFGVSYVLSTWHVGAFFWLVIYGVCVAFKWKAVLKGAVFIKWACEGYPVMGASARDILGLWSFVEGFELIWRVLWLSKDYNLSLRFTRWSAVQHTLSLFGPHCTRYYTQETTSMHYGQHGLENGCRPMWIFVALCPRALSGSCAYL